MRLWLVVACFLMVLGVSYNFGPDTVFFANDQALSFAVVARALHGEIPLAGPPSHVGGRHLGPFYYWYLALTQLIGGGLHGALVVGAVFAAATVVLIGWRVGGAKGALVAVLFGLAGYLDTIRIPWHPHILLPFAAVFIYATEKLFRSGVVFLGWWAFTGSVLSQSHSAAVPFTVGVGMVVVVWVVRNLRDLNYEEIWRGRFGWTAAFVSLIPMMFYNFYVDPNLGRLFQTHSEVVVGAGFREVCGALFDFVRLHVFGLGWSRWLSALFFLAATAALFLDRGARQRAVLGFKENVWACCAVGAGVLLTAIALSRFKSPIYDYYWSVLLPIPLIAGAWTVNLIKPKRNLSALLWAALIIVVCYSAIIGVLRFGARPFVRQHTLGHAEQIVTAMKELAVVVPVGEEIQVVTRLYASSMKNTYNFLFDSPGRFNQLEVSYKFKEFSGVPAQDMLEGGFAGRWRQVVFCPMPYSKELKRMMSSFRKRWAVVDQRILSGERVADRCLVRLLKRKDSVLDQERHP